MILKQVDFKQNCNFRLEKGKEGVGSVSFLHIDTNQYLYRDNNNMLIFKNINNTKTEDRQRVSFNIIDGLSNGIILKVIPIEGETTDKYIMIDEPYLNISTINDDNITKKNRYTKTATFYIVDNIINTQIIDNKNKISNITIPTSTNSPRPTYTPTFYKFTPDLYLHLQIQPDLYLHLQIQPDLYLHLQIQPDLYLHIQIIL